MHLTPRNAARPLRLGRFFVAMAVLACGLGPVACSHDEDPRGGAARDSSAAGSAAVVVEGMSMEEVLAAWGTPSLKVRQGAGERWSYWVRDEHHRVVGRTYVVFDERKRVVEVVRPDLPRPGKDPKEPTVVAAGAEASADRTT